MRLLCFDLSGCFTDDGFTGQMFDDDDPAKEKEAEIMLEYIEKFTELMQDEKYEEAALHAANSPKGILRTAETMQKFMGSAAVCIENSATQ